MRAWRLTILCLGAAASGCAEVGVSDPLSIRLPSLPETPVIALSEGAPPDAGALATVISAQPWSSDEGDYVSVKLAYLGGCGSTFSVWWDGSSRPGATPEDPPQATLILRRDATGEACQQVTTHRLLVRMQPIAARLPVFRGELVNAAGQGARFSWPPLL